MHSSAFYICSPKTPTPDVCRTCRRCMMFYSLPSLLLTCLLPGSKCKYRHLTSSSKRSGYQPLCWQVSMFCTEINVNDCTLTNTEEKATQILYHELPSWSARKTDQADERELASLVRILWADPVLLAEEGPLMASMSNWTRVSGNC